MVCIPSAENLVSKKWILLITKLLRESGFGAWSLLEYFTLAKKQNIWKVVDIYPGWIVLKSFKDLTLLVLSDCFAKVWLWLVKGAITEAEQWHERKQYEGDLDLHALQLES